MNKILLIGLDGATFRLMEPWIVEDMLPNLKKLYCEGMSSILNSTPYPNSGSAWVSSITGVNPGKHGIFGFGVRDDYNNYRLRLANSTAIRVKTIPLILTEYKYSSILINVPISYPPYKFNGYLVSGMLTPSSSGNFTYPENLKYELLKKVPSYITEVSPYDFNLDSINGKISYRDALLESIKARTTAAKMLMEDKDWDFFMVVFSELDRIQHIFWAEMDENHILHSQKDKSLSSTILDTYRELDRAIGELIDRLPSDTNVFIISDHGFGPYEKIFYMNRFLIEEGLLKLKEERYSKINKKLREFAKRIPLPEFIYRNVKDIKHDKSNIKKIIDPRAEIKKIAGWIPEEMIEWKKTKAFTDQYGIRFNLRGREPQGIVTPGKESRELSEFLKEELRKLKYPHNNKYVFIDVKDSCDIYSGDLTDKAPDLVTFMKTGTPHPSCTADMIFGDSANATGSHKKEGILIAWGDGIRSGNHMEPSSILDITPTILYDLDIPLTVEMDGNVLDIFEEKLKLERINNRIGTSKRDGVRDKVFKPEEDSEIRDRLRDLGYLD